MSFQLFSMSLVTCTIMDPSIPGIPQVEVMRESYCVRVYQFTSKSEVEIFASAVMNSGVERMHVVGEQSGFASKPSSDVKERIAVSLNESRSVSDRSAPLVERGR